MLPTSSDYCMPQGLYLIISIFWHYFADILSIIWLILIISLCFMSLSYSYSLKPLFITSLLICIDILVLTFHFTVSNTAVHLSFRGNYSFVNLYTLLMVAGWLVDYWPAVQHRKQCTELTAIEHVSACSVVTLSMYGEIFNYHFIANFPYNFSGKVGISH